VYCIIPDTSLTITFILLVTDNLVLLTVCFQEEMTQISHNELMDLNAIAQGRFGKVYRAKHARFGSVVYKELDVPELGDQYVIFFPD